MFEFIENLIGNLMHRHIDAIITHEWERAFFISRSNPNPNALYDREYKKEG